MIVDSTAMLSSSVSRNTALGQSECPKIDDARTGAVCLAVAQVEIGEADDAVGAHREQSEIRVGASAHDGNASARSGDAQRLVDDQCPAPGFWPGEGNCAVESRGKGDRGAACVLDRLAKGALLSVAHPVARIGQAVDYKVAGGGTRRIVGGR